MVWVGAGLWFRRLTRLIHKTSCNFQIVNHQLQGETQLGVKRVPPGWGRRRRAHALEGRLVSWASM